MKFKLFPVLFFLSLVSITTHAQPSIQRIDPPNWWVGMKNNKIDLLVYGKDLKSVTEIKSAVPSFRILGFKPMENPDYFWVSVEIGQETIPGFIDLEFTAGKKNFIVKYEVKQREKISNENHPNMIYSRPKPRTTLQMIIPVRSEI